MIRNVSWKTIWQRPQAFTLALFATLILPAPAHTSPAYKTILADVVGLDVLDERTVRYRFKKPNRELPLTVRTT